MNIRWRENEVLLVSLLAAITLASYGWHLYQLTMPGAAASYTTAFEAAGVPFQLGRNLWWPQVGMALGLYAAYRYVNWRIIPAVGRALQPQPSLAMAGRLAGALAQVGGVALLLAVGANLATYYGHPHLLNYGPDFRLLALFGYNEQPFSKLSLLVAGQRALVLLAVYAGYAAGRELTVQALERPDARRAYRVLITNQLTALVVVYLALGYFLVTFGLGTETFLEIYFLLVPPVGLVYFSTTYWLFPATPVGQVWQWRYIGRLALTTLLCIAPFALPLGRAVGHDMEFAALLGSWALQLLVTTPLAWLIYQQRQDKISQLRGAERQLGHFTAEVQRLRSQINPHFLFNVLNTLYGTALLEHAGRTAEGIQRLGDMMRFMLQESTQELIPLRQEVDYLNNYLALQTLRLPVSPHLRIDAQLTEATDGYHIAPMLLQPLVENAFNHGISLQQDSWIYIRLQADAAGIHFEVRNSLHPRPTGPSAQPSTGLGLRNVTERLQLLYGSRHELHHGAQNGEYVVQLTLRHLA